MSDEVLLVSRARAAEILGVSPRRVGQLVVSDGLEFVQVGKQKQLVYESLVEFVERRRTRAAPPASEARERLRVIADRKRRPVI